MGKKPLGEFEQLLMFALLELGDDAYGRTVRQAVEERAGRQVSPGAVYTALERLEARDLVSSRRGESTPERGGRRKKYYRLEPEGAAALKESYERLTRMAEGLTPKLAELAGRASSRSER